MYQEPKSRAENRRMTKDFTRRLAKFSELLGGDLGKGPVVFESGNGMPEDDAYIFNVVIDGMNFNVEVFGPYWDADYDGGKVVMETPSH